MVQGEVTYLEVYPSMVIMNTLPWFRERSLTGKAELADCADLAGSEILGLQVEYNKVYTALYKQY